ncbi:serine hydrolase BPHL-like [Tubulanus polymorphus]|uniref:serine hydrolase BPHL-like n=1 Tax=Tubulanus polymorphus TaxID=672921 RepID=UPI003DA3F8A8
MVDVSGKTIHYEIVGNTNADRTILLIPGALGSGKTDFGPQLKHNWGEDVTLVAFDPPGYGKSTPPERKWTEQFLHNDAEVAAKFMKKIGKPYFSVMGWSDGGNTGVILAARYPKLVHKLVIWGSNSYCDEEMRACYHGIDELNKWSHSRKQPYIDMYGYEKFKDLWESWVQSILKYASNGEEGNIYKDDLKNVKCPTLILHGDKDPQVPVYHPTYLHENIAGSTLKRYPNGKHNIHLRYADAFNERVKQFLDD